MSQFPQSSDPFSPVEPPAKGMSIAALITGILGIVPPIGIVGIILGVIAMRRAKAEPSRYGGEGMAVGGIIAGSVTTLMVCVIGGLVAILLPALGQARQVARHVHAQTNLSQIGMAIAMYASDHKDAFPPQEWKAALVPAYTNDGVFARVGSDLGGDAFIYAIQYKRLSDVPQPGRTIVAYETPPCTMRGRVLVLYVDGSVRTVSEAELTAGLAAGAKPSGGGKSNP